MTPVLFVLGLTQMEEPVVTVASSGTVNGSVVLPASESEVRLLLANAEQLYGLSPEVVKVQVTGHRGGCQEVTTETKALLSTMTFRELRCPTVDGYSHQLVESEDFERYNLTWHTREVEGGTELSYELDASMSGPVPDRMVGEMASKAAMVQLSNIYSLYARVVR